MPTRVASRRVSSVRDNFNRQWSIFGQRWRKELSPHGGVLLSVVAAMV